jgi:hypothetical protein
MAWRLVIIGPGNVTKEVETQLEELNLSSNRIQARIAGGVQQAMAELSNKYKKLIDLLNQLPETMTFRNRANGELFTVAQLKAGYKPQHDGPHWYLGEEQGARGASREGEPHKLLCIAGQGYAYSEVRP